MTGCQGILQEAHSSSHGTDMIVVQAKAGGRKGKDKGKALQRPLIAICNDLYVPALRPLRAVARILHFTQPQVSLGS